MSDLHIDDFYRDAAKIFLQLYSTFPKKSTVLVEDIAGPDNPDEFGLPSDRHQACFGAMIWLADSGYINYQETIRQEALDQAELTHKAFTLLSSNGDSSQPLVDNYVKQLRQILTDGSSSQLALKMQELLRQSHHFS